MSEVDFLVKNVRKGDKLSLEKIRYHNWHSEPNMSLSMINSFAHPTVDVRVQLASLFNEGFKPLMDILDGDVDDANIERVEVLQLKAYNTNSKSSAKRKMEPAIVKLAAERMADGRKQSADVFGDWSCEEIIKISGLKRKCVIDDHVTDTIEPRRVTTGGMCESSWVRQYDMNNNVMQSTSRQFDEGVLTIEQASQCWTKVQLRVRIITCDMDMYMYTIHIFPNGKMQIQGKLPSAEVDETGRVLHDTVQQFQEELVRCIYTLLFRNGCSDTPSPSFVIKNALWVFSGNTGVFLEGWGIGENEQLFYELLTKRIAGVSQEVNFQKKKDGGKQKQTLVFYMQFASVKVHIDVWRTGNFQIKASKGSMAEYNNTAYTRYLQDICKGAASIIMCMVREGVDSGYLTSRSTPFTRTTNNSTRSSSDLKWTTLLGRPMSQFKTKMLVDMIERKGVTFQDQLPVRKGLRWQTGSKKKFAFILAKNLYEGNGDSDISSMIDLDKSFVPKRVLKKKIIAQ